MNFFAGLMMVTTVACTFGCATSFTGSAYVEGGRSACEKRCQTEGLEIAGMVYMGEYSNACVCAVPGKNAANRELLVASAETAGAAVGVAMQQQRQQEKSNQNH